MVENDIVAKLTNAFPGSTINRRNEFIAHQRANQYFILENCATEFDVQCKVLEWFSRAAFKTEPFNNSAKNHKFHLFMLAGINRFLNTHFTTADMEEIYTYLGNACNHEKTVNFIRGGYDMSILMPSQPAGGAN